MVVAIRMNALVYLFNHTTSRKKSNTIITTTTTTNILARIATYCMEQAYDDEENRIESNLDSFESKSKKKNPPSVFASTFINRADDE